jgi:BASS family bile acid:Na+ symporter
MLVRAKKQATARRLEKPVRILSAFFLLLIIAAALAKDGKNLTAALTACGLPVICFNLTSLGVGYFVPRLLRLPERQSIAIGMEIGIHNGTLAIAIATTVLGRDAMALPPAIYSIVMFFTAAVFGALVQRRGAPRPVASDVVA